MYANLIPLSREFQSQAAASQAKDPLETQPLWEYEGVARGLSIPLTKDIKSGAVLNFTYVS